MTPNAATNSTAPTGADVVFTVDDEETDRRLFRRAMEAAGIPHPCRQFSCGDEMLDALIGVLRGAPPPLACFIDVKMRGMSGLDVLRWIRAQHGLREIPVIMLSSSEAPDHLSEALIHGAQCYVAKFPPPETLREIFAAAKRFTAAAYSGASFDLPCNLLLSARHAVA